VVLDDILKTFKLKDASKATRKATYANSRTKWIHSDGEMCIFYEDAWSIGKCPADSYYYRYDEYER
jgi:hypothetical protein